MSTRSINGEDTLPGRIESRLGVHGSRFAGKPTGAQQARRIGQKQIESFRNGVGRQRVADPAVLPMFGDYGKRTAAADNRWQAGKLGVEDDEAKACARLGQDW